MRPKVPAIAKPFGEAGPAMSIAHVVASVDDPAAGPSASVPALARALRDRGAAVRIHTVAGWRGAPASQDFSDIDVRRHPPTTGVLGRVVANSSQLRQALVREAGEPGIIHTHGLWLAPNMLPGAIANTPRSRAKFIMSPRGMLGREALKFSAWRKKLVWALAQRQAALAAHCVHATAASELEEIRAAGLRQPVAVIPNGIEVPAPGNRQKQAGTARVAISLGRVHPKKGLDRLIAAWAQVEHVHPDWRLRIIGPPEDGYDDVLRKMKDDLGLANVSIEPGAFGEAKRRTYEEADLFVLPTLNENFAMTVAEALSHALPVIATRGAPWQGLEKNACGWWIGHGPESMAQALSSAMSLSDTERDAMGTRGRAWMIRDFAWRRVGDEMLGVYNWLVGGGVRPASVVID